MILSGDCACAIGSEAFYFRNVSNPLYLGNPLGLAVAGRGAYGADSQKAIRASWADYDVDGYLDLFIANGGTTGSSNSMYRNNRDGTFTRITTNAIATEPAGGYCGVWTDFDNDGDPDLHVVQGQTFPDFFYRNDRNGVFTELQPAFITA